MKKYRKLLELISQKESVLVAFSGGVDSTLVALASHEMLGSRTRAVMFDNETIPRTEVQDAKQVASEIGIQFHIEKQDILGIVEITSNPVDRCGVCKGYLMSRLLEISDEEGFGVVADGANADDPRDYRPGLASSDRLGIYHPLMEAGIGKEDARAILREKGISIHDKPSTTCLMTRIPYGENITVEKLSIIDRIEERVRILGFRDIRLRLFERGVGGFIGVLEVDDPQRALENWGSINIDPGEVRIVLDGEGYRQGSMNKGLVPP